MTQKIAIVTDSTSDIPKEMSEKLGITVLDAYVIFGTESFTSSEMSLEEFHNRLASASKKNFPTTSQPSAQDLLGAYEKLKEQGYTDILSIHVSHKLSGTVNSANVAKGMIEGVNVHIVDSSGVTANLLACVLEAKKMIDKGQKAEEIADEIAKFGKSLTGYFSVATLDNLVKGGRMSPIRYRLGKLLKIKPILKLNDGVLSAHDKAKGEHLSRDMTFGFAIEGRSSNDEFNYIIAHTREPSLAERYEKRLNTEFPNANGFTIEIGIAVATHAGPSCLFCLTY